MRKILFAVIMAAGVGMVGTSASAAPAAPISNGISNNVQEAQYYGHRRHHHRRACRSVRVCDGYGYCRWRTRCY